MFLRKLLIALLVASSLGFAQGFAGHVDSVIEILVDADECIKGLEGNKLYLNEENIITTSEGIFLVTDHFDPIPITNLFSDENGCYIKLSNELTAAIKEGLGWDGTLINECPRCGNRYFLTCLNPICKLKKAKEERKKKRQN